MGHNDIIIDSRLILQIITIFGWFWLIVFTIYRFGCLKKSVFSILVIIYFSRAVMRVTEMISLDGDLRSKSLAEIVINLLTIFGFYILTKKIIKLREKNEKLSKI